MRCVECGAEMGSAPTCRRCGAPVPERLRHQAPSTRAANQHAAKWSKALRVIGWTVVVLVNLVSLWLAIAMVVQALIEGDPNQDGNIPLWACAFLALMFSIIPAVSVRILVQRRLERRAEASDSPGLLQEMLD